MRVFTAPELLAQPRVVPYDAFAVWLHATQRPDVPIRQNSDRQLYSQNE